MPNELFNEVKDQMTYKNAPTDYGMMELQEMSVLQLRKLCQHFNIGSGVWRAGASKKDLIMAIDAGAGSQPEQAAAAAAAPVSAGNGSLGAILAREIEPFIRQQATVNEERLVELIKEHAPVNRVEIDLTKADGNKEQIDLGVQHKHFTDLLQFCKARVNVWLTGPAGSGKTTAAANVAKALRLPFYFNGAIDNEYKLLGFTDAQGRIVSRPFRKAFTEGGVYLFDEVDGSLPPALLAFNAALANGHCDFPDGCFSKHGDFICIAAANTWGLGGTSDYVGRLKQDAAFLDRFAQLDWPYDEKLERSICPNDDWTNYIQQCRHNAKKHGLKVVISPRASMNGARLLAAGLDREKVIAATVRKGMDDAQWAKIAP
jgi:cobaltochelatase CobS